MVFKGNIQELKNNKYESNFVQEGIDNEWLNLKEKWKMVFSHYNLTALKKETR